MKTDNEDKQPRSLITLTMIIETLLRWRRFIVWSTTLCVAIATVTAFLITPKFRSTASIFPAEKADLFSAFGALEGVSSLVKSFSPARSLASLGRDPELDKYLAILKSSRVLDDVIGRFDLVNIYGYSGSSYPMEKTTRELLANAEFDIEPEGNLTISVHDEDPRRAADMANFFVDALNRTNTDLLAQNARGNRLFIEERYLKNLKDLATAEESLKAFQQHYGVIAMPEQTEATIKAAAELTAALALKEVQLGVQRRTQSPDHPSVIATRIETEELGRKLTQMNFPTSSSAGQMKVLVPFKSIPDLGTEYLRRYREVEIQYKILQFITPLYEQAKVEEQRQTPSVVVLDRGTPAERKSKPKRLFIILGGMLIGFFGSMTFAALSERWGIEKATNTQLHQSVSKLVASLGEDIETLKHRFKRNKKTV